MDEYGVSKYAHRNQGREEVNINMGKKLNCEFFFSGSLLTVS
jgi:hypothetical protein